MASVRQFAPIPFRERFAYMEARREALKLDRDSPECRRVWYLYMKMLNTLEGDDGQ